MTTFAPIEIPMKRFIKIFITGPLLPTAANAWWVENRPMIAMSIALKDCCYTPLAINGIANSMILRKRLPLCISIFMASAFISCKVTTHLSYNGRDCSVKKCKSAMADKGMFLAIFRNHRILCNFACVFKNTQRNV